MIRLNLPSFDIKVSGSKQHPQILDVLRRKFITLTPEEWVRQHFVHFLIEHKGVSCLVARQRNPAEMWRQGAARRQCALLP